MRLEDIEEAMNNLAPELLASLHGVLAQRGLGDSGMAKAAKAQVKGTSIVITMPAHYQYVELGRAPHRRAGPANTPPPVSRNTRMGTGKAHPDTRQKRQIFEL